MSGTVLQLRGARDPASAATVNSLENALAVLANAASARMSDTALEQERQDLVKTALGAARTANAALHMWAAQCLSEYRGSRTTWDVHATSELLGVALGEFATTARETADGLVALMPEIQVERSEPWREETPVVGSLRRA